MATCNIAITSRPVLDDVRDMPGYPGWAHWSLRQPMEAVATVTFASGEEVGAGWSVGWLQTISFNNWALYRGATTAAGSAWLHKSSPTADLITALDSEALGVPFAFNADQPQRLWHGGQLPVAVWLRNKPTAPIKLMLQDGPDFAFPYQITNGRTGAVNRLTEARIEMQFCAVVGLRDPQGRFTLVGGLTWMVIWANQMPANARQLILPPGPDSRAQAGAVFAGAPPNGEVVRILTGPRLSNYNDLINRRLHPEQKESDGWPSWPVRR